MPGRYTTALLNVRMGCEKILQAKYFGEITFTRAQAMDVLKELGVPQAEAEDSLHYKFCNILGKTINVFGLVEILMDREFERLNNPEFLAKDVEQIAESDLDKNFGPDEMGPDEFHQVSIALDAIKQFEDKYVKQANQILSDTLKRHVTEVARVVSSEHKKTDADASATESSFEEWTNQVLQSLIRQRLAKSESTGKHGIVYPAVLNPSSYPTVLEEIEASQHLKPVEDIYHDTQSFIHPHISLEELAAIKEGLDENGRKLAIILNSDMVQEKMGLAANWYINAQYELRRDMSRYLEGYDLFKEQTGYNSFDSRVAAANIMSGG